MLLARKERQPMHFVLVLELIFMLYVCWFFIFITVQLVREDSGALRFMKMLKIYHQMEIDLNFGLDR